MVSPVTQFNQNFINKITKSIKLMLGFIMEHSKKTEWSYFGSSFKVIES